MSGDVFLYMVFRGYRLHCRLLNRGAVLTHAERRAKDTMFLGSLVTAVKEFSSVIDFCTVRGLQAPSRHGRATSNSRPLGLEK